MTTHETNLPATLADAYQSGDLAAALVAMTPPCEIQAQDAVDSLNCLLASPIDGPDDVAGIQGAIVEVERVKKLIIADRDPYRDAFHRAKQSVIDSTKAATEPIDAAVTAARKTLKEWEREQERLRAAAEAKAKREAEERRKAEQDRLDKEALDRAAKLEEQGRTAEAAQTLVQREEQAVQAAQEPLVEILPPSALPPVVPKVAGFRKARTTWPVEVHDLRSAMIAVANDPGMLIDNGPGLSEAVRKCLTKRAAAQRESFAFPGCRIAED